MYTYIRMCIYTYIHVIYIFVCKYILEYIKLTHVYYNKESYSFLNKLY